tara:strand:+ start:466 stop:798 length:333 start_codon:yes stop_codon:yes gene_type:complete
MIIDITQERLDLIIKEEVINVYKDSAGIEFDVEEYKDLNLYEILSTGGLLITETASEEGITEAFRASAYTGTYRHPSYGGNTEKFNFLTRAYATLRFNKGAYDSHRKTMM